MKICADKIDSLPPHGLRIRDVKLTLKSAPPEWTVNLKEVRLANSLEYYSPYAYYSRHDGSLTIYSRTGTQEQVIHAILSALAVEKLGMNRGIGRHRAEAEKYHINQIIQPLIEMILAALTAENEQKIHRPIRRIC